MIMETTICAAIFSVDFYDRFELEKMSDKELINLVTENYDETKADILELGNFQDFVNDEVLDLNGWWVFFVDNGYYED